MCTPCTYDNHLIVVPSASDLAPFFFRLGVVPPVAPVFGVATVVVIGVLDIGSKCSRTRGRGQDLAHNKAAVLNPDFDMKTPTGTTEAGEDIVGWDPMFEGGSREVIDDGVNREMTPSNSLTYTGPTFFVSALHCTTTLSLCVS